VAVPAPADAAGNEASDGALVAADRVADTGRRAGGGSPDTDAGATAQAGLARAANGTASMSGLHATSVEPASATPPLDGGVSAAAGAWSVQTPSSEAGLPSVDARALPGDAADAMIAPDLRSPAFAPALGARVVLLLRDGVREARLQINPADLGPVSVRIALDGSIARVELLADKTPTRIALEQALPALAGALRDAGLTLGGGGVFDAAHDRGDPHGGSRSGNGAHDHGSRPGGSPSTADDGFVPDRSRLAAIASSARGLVDLYA
jgi:flagellar hook-length control protein FliK